MIKNTTILEVKVGERVYQMLCSSDSPLGELFDTLSAMRSHVAQIIIEQSKEKETQEDGQAV